MSYDMDQVVAEIAAMDRAKADAREKAERPFLRQPSVRRAIVLAVGCCAFFFLGLFPPWRQTTIFAGSDRPWPRIERPVGHYSIMGGPENALPAPGPFEGDKFPIFSSGTVGRVYAVDYARLAMLWAMTAALTLAGCVLVPLLPRSEDSTSREEAAASPKANASASAVAKPRTS